MALKVGAGRATHWARAWSRSFASLCCQPGDRLPAVKLQEGTPDTLVDIAQLFGGKKGVLFGVPGAFTPGCSRTHLPGYVRDYEQLKAAGVDVIACVAVNDVFVMDAWGKALHADGKVRGRTRRAPCAIARYASARLM